MKSFVWLFGFLLCNVILNGIIKPTNVEAQHVQDFKVVFSLNILERVTDYGQTAKLFCDVGPKFKTPVGFWDIFIPEPTLAFAVVKNKSQRNDTKYSGQFVDNGFTLEIRNLSKDDLNIRYKCSVDNNVSVPLLLLEADVFSGNLHLAVEKKISDYGETLKLVCVTESCNNETCHWKYGWRRYLPGVEFEMERLDWQNTRANSKYNSHLVNDGFNLEIRNASITDLNINYECYLPFNKSELLNLSKAVAFKEFFSNDNDKGSEVIVIVAITVGVLVFVIGLMLLIVLIVRKLADTPDPGKQDEMQATEMDVLEEQAPTVDHGIERCEREESENRSLLINSQNSYDLNKNATANRLTLEDSFQQEDAADTHSDVNTRHKMTKREQRSKVVQVCHEMMRDLINVYIKPWDLYTIFNGSNLGDFLNSKEKDIFEDVLSTYEYDKCNTELIFKLLARSNCMPSPRKGWMSTPEHGSTTPSDDVVRIHRAVYANCHSIDFTDEHHELFFTTLKSVAERIDKKLMKKTDIYKRKIESIENQQLACID